MNTGVGGGVSKVSPRFEERHVETIGVFNTELIFKQERRDKKMTVYLAVPSVLTPQFAALDLHHS